MRGPRQGVAQWGQYIAQRHGRDQHNTATTSNVTNATGSKANFQRSDRRCKFIAVGAQQSGRTSAEPGPARRGCAINITAIATRLAARHGHSKNLETP